MIAMLLKRQRRPGTAQRGRVLGLGCGSGKTGDCCESAAAATALQERVALYARGGCTRQECEVCRGGTLR